jgi:hypothetical protein
LPVFGQHPRACPDLVGHAKILELLEPADEKTGLGTVAPLYEGASIDAPVARPLIELAIERRETLLSDLPLLRAPNLGLQARAEPLSRQFLRSPPKAPRDVGAIHAQGTPLAADSSDDDVGMRMLGVVVVNGRPLHGAAEVALDAPRQLADVAREIEIARIFGRYDEPELVPLAQARLLEDLSRHGPFSTVESTGRAVLLDAVTLDVPQVPRSRLGAVCSELLQVRFDDYAASVLPRAEAGGRRELRRRPAAAPPVTLAHERRDSKGARGHPIAPARAPAKPRPQLPQPLVGAIRLAHHHAPSPPALLGADAAPPARSRRAANRLQRSRKSFAVLMR